jgi:hypothetical protein
MFDGAARKANTAHPHGSGEQRLAKNALTFEQIVVIAGPDLRQRSARSFNALAANADVGSKFCNGLPEGEFTGRELAYTAGVQSLTSNP